MGNNLWQSRTTLSHVAVHTTVTMAVVAIVLSTLVGCISSVAHAAVAPFDANSSWRTSLAAGAPVDPNSAAMISWAARQDAMTANLVQFGIPIYHADAATRRYTVRCTVTTWGQCPFAGLGIPIPDGARPQSGSDGAMVVIDNSTQKIFEFWQARNLGGRWTTSWGAINNLSGSGWGGASTGSGASRLGGVIRLSEVEQGFIPHALAIQSDNACAGVYRAPATKTDGRSLRWDCIPEGVRLRLDPGLDLNALPLSPAERMVGRALQTYGAYVMDVGGAPLSVSFERDPTANARSIGSIYTAAGLRWDYDDLGGLPWRRLQVLR